MRHVVVRIKQGIRREDSEDRGWKRIACRHHGTTCALRLVQTCSRSSYIRINWQRLVQLPANIEVERDSGDFEERRCFASRVLDIIKGVSGKTFLTGIPDLSYSTFALASSELVRDRDINFRYSQLRPHRVSFLT